MKTTVSPLQIVLKSVCLLYGKNDSGKSFLLRSIDGMHHRVNKQNIKVTNKPANVYVDVESMGRPSPTALFVYSSYFNPNVPIRDDPGLTVEEFMTFQLQCLRYDKKYHNCERLIYGSWDLMEQEMYLDLVTKEIRYLSTSQRNVINLLQFVICNRFTPIWLLDEPFEHLNSEEVNIFCAFFNHVNKSFGITIVLTSQKYPNSLMEIVDNVAYIENRNVRCVWKKELWHQRIEDILGVNIRGLNVDAIRETITECLKDIPNHNSFDNNAYKNVPLAYITNYNSSKCVDNHYYSGESFAGRRIDQLSWKSWYFLTVALFMFRWRLDGKRKVFVYTLWFSTFLTILLGLIDNISSLSVTSGKADSYSFLLETFQFDFMNVCAFVFVDIVIIVYTCFLFRKEDRHCNLEIHRGIYIPSNLFFYRIAYASLMSAHLVMSVALVDLLVYAFVPKMLYLWHMVISIVINVIIGVILCCSINNVYGKIVTAFCLTLTRFVFTERILQLLAYMFTSDDLLVAHSVGDIVSVQFERFYYTVLSLIDAEFGNFVTLACDFRTTYLERNYNITAIVNVQRRSVINRFFLYFSFDSFIHVSAYSMMFVNICVLCILGLYLYKKFTHCNTIFQ